MAPIKKSEKILGFSLTISFSAIRVLLRSGSLECFIRPVCSSVPLRPPSYSSSFGSRDTALQRVCPLCPDSMGTAGRVEEKFSSGSPVCYDEFVALVATSEVGSQASVRLARTKARRKTDGVLIMGRAACAPFVYGLILDAGLATVALETLPASRVFGPPAGRKRNVNVG